MKKTALLSTILGSIVAAMMQIAPAPAQTRTWVSGVGDDLNPCSRTAPCKTFAGAISKTAADGEINCLDPGGFGAVTITKAISIDCVTTEGGVLAAGTNAIIVNVPAGTSVFLRGLDILGTSAATNGINLIQAGNLYVDKCIIRQFNSASSGNGNGIKIAPTGATEVYVTNTLVTDNGGGTFGAGIQVVPSGGATVNVVLDRVNVNDNNTGVFVNGTSGTNTRLQMVNSTASGNNAAGGAGVTAFTGGPATTVMVINSLLSGNGTGAVASGAAAVVILGATTVTGNGTAMTASGGALFSYKNNNVNDNGAVGTAPTVIPQT